ncbi:Pumilio homolog 3 [Seminavis robusta]|uniref:Pumilio homolog 3 n=1 Tax=Seminavis robusta TaxID=568900 RepID=A0A9N8EDT7_9STRA|nr:Pumilio homolog 3 [Seminavis robusta]|eukprot:Sro796_g203760.1 Pumilio homolog 3 (597) ;mRNA; r:24418-26208
MPQQQKDQHSKKRKSDDVSAKSQKRALKQERQSHRKHADCVTEAKKIWNQLRLKNNSKEETRKMTEELMALIKGKTTEIALQHDASRVVQAALQFGTNDERKEILSELCDNSNTKKVAGAASSGSAFVELARNQYAHFVVLKAIKYGVHSPDCIRLIVKSLKGHMAKLAVHATGAKVVEALVQTFPNKSTAPLRQEFYGPQLSLFVNDLAAASAGTNNQTPDLAFHFQNLNDKKKETALTFIRNQILEKGIEKSLFGYNYYQSVFAEYVTHCSPHQVRDIAPSVCDHAVHFLSSKAGTKVVAACVAYGTAKDRRRICKSLKGYSRSALLHRDAYLAILRLVQVMDDTVSVQKYVFHELLTRKDGDDDDDDSDPLLEIALHDLAYKLFVMLLTSNKDDWKKSFDPYELSVLEPNPPMIQEGGQMVPTSKKDPETRRQELAQHLQKPLIELCTNHARELMTSLSGSVLIRLVYANYHPTDLVEAIVKVCEDELTKKDDEEGSLYEDRVGHLAIKNLILCDVEEEEPLLAKAFCDKLKDQLMEIAKSNRGAFVVAALCKIPSVRKSVVEKVKKQVPMLKKRMGDKAHAGFQTLLKEIEK